MQGATSVNNMAFIPTQPPQLTDGPWFSRSRWCGVLEPSPLNLVHIQADKQNLVASKNPMHHASRVAKLPAAGGGHAG